jgi:hypothetical protein
MDPAVAGPSSLHGRPLRLYRMRCECGSVDVAQAAEAIGKAEALFEFGESRDARGDRWLRPFWACAVATCARAKSPVNPAEPAPRTRQTENRRKLERVKGIEPSYSAWKAAALPLSYTREALVMGLGLTGGRTVTRVALPASMNL